MGYTKEIRPINGQLYYCQVDYSTNKNGDIINITKRILAPLNNTNSEIRNVEGTNKIVNVDPGKSDDEITDYNEIQEVENMADTSEIRRQILDDIENKQKTQRLEQELAITQEYVKTFDKTLDDRLGELGSKLDKISAQKERNESIDNVIQRARDQVPVRITKEVDEINCPGCAKDGHKHSLKKTSNGTLKCTGKECATEYLLVNKVEKFDGNCKDCGMSVSKSMDACPNCGGTHAVKFNK